MLKNLFPEETFYSFDTDSIAENLIQYINEYRIIYTNISQTSYHRQLMRVTLEPLEHYLLQGIRNNSNCPKTPVYPEIKAKYSCGGLVTLIFWWFENPEISLDELRLQIQYILATIKESWRL